MSGVKLQEERVNGVYCHNLQNVSFISMLAQYRKLLLSAYGPKGGTLLINNAVGRHKLAVSSGDIIKQLSFCHPCVKYVNALISAQNASCGLGGLYTGILCIRLLEESLKCEDSTPHHVIADLSDWIIDQLLKQVAQFPPQVVTDLDIGDIQQVSSFVKTILGSKSILNFSKAEVDNVSIQIVRAFLKSIPEDNATTTFGHINISLEGSPGSDAMIFEGLLYREPEFDPKLSQRIAALPPVINVLLFAIPLSLDGSTDACLLWSGSQTKEETFINSILSSLISFLKKKNVHILANQKVIHPIIKFELERKGYLVLERLGTVPTNLLVKLSGCQAVTNLSSLMQEMNNVTLGQLSSVQHVSLRGKNYILLKQGGASLCTLLLSEASPNTEESLKEIVESCLSALKMAVVNGRVVVGGGCLEAWLATQVTHMLRANIEHLMSLTNAPVHHIFKVGSAFVRVFMEMAIQLAGGSTTTKFDWCVDSVFHHLWNSQARSTQDSTEIVSKCVCGLLTDEDIRNKYKGDWHDLEFQINQNPFKNSFESPCSCPSLTCVDKVDGELSDFNYKIASEDRDVGIDADSLDENVRVEDDADSLEKTLNSLEDEGDSLEGILENREDDIDSLEDMLNKVEDQAGQPKNSSLKVRLDSRIPNVLFDSYLAKYNSMRLALEGFTQLFQVGQCVFDQ